MTINKFELRSRDVQEVMESIPGRLMFFGNLTILLIILCSLIISSRLHISESIPLPCRVINVNYQPDRNICVLNLFVGSIPKDIKLEQSVTIHLSDLVSSNIGELHGKILGITGNGYCIICGLDADDFQPVKEQKVILTSLLQGMVGSIKVKTGNTSILQLFLRRLSR